MNFSTEIEHWLEGFRSTLMQVIESPKTTAAASTMGATAGVAVAAQWVNSAVGITAALCSIVVTLLLARVHWLKGEQHKLEIEHQQMENEMLRKKVREAGLQQEESM
jgi:4-hydroxybenzoate polyprenyltransferase